MITGFGDMFYFGDPWDNARMFLKDVVFQLSGQELNEAPFDEMTRTELELLLVRIRLALQKAVQEGMPSEEYQCLLTWHDGAVEALCYVSAKFRRRVASGAYPSPKVGNPNGREFYKKMAKAINSEP